MVSKIEGRRAFYLRVLFARQPFFSFGLPSHLNLSSQESFDYPKDGYVRGSWEDMFLSCKESTRKLLVDHLLKDGSQ